MDMCDSFCCVGLPSLSRLQFMDVDENTFTQRSRDLKYLNLVFVHSQFMCCSGKLFVFNINCNI
jgi:hypothetical protein